MAICKSYCKDCGCTVGHKPDCPIWERESNKRAEAVRNQCKHGQLARSCNICELEQENEKLKADVAMPREAAECVCKKLEHPTDSVTALDMWKLRDALSETASSGAWLNEQKAKVLEKAANELEDSDEHLRIYGTGEHHHATQLRRMAAELRRPESDIDQAQRIR